MLYMKQKVFSWTDRFTIKDAQGNDRYYVEGEFFTWGKKLHVYDSNNQEVAFIRQKVMTWLPRCTVEIDGREVCEIVKKLTLFKQQYVLEGLPWHVEGDIWAHEYNLMNDTDTLMRVSKHWFTWGDSYEMAIAEGTDELLCLCVVLAIDVANAQTAAAASSSS